LNDSLLHASARVAANGSAFARLAPAERRVAVSAAFHLLLYWWMLRWSGTRRLLARRRAALPAPSRRSARAHRSATRRVDHGPDVGRLCAQVAAVAERLRLPSTCLTRALVVRHLLEREGIVADVRIGVALERSHLSAHAWIEHGGRPVFDRTHAAYAPFEPRAAASPAAKQ
jgi:hypothetical protein